ncbi:MAG: glycosyltransferase [Rhodospirillaceae bacterium]|nr:glycosyltransferase [Rhodospirillaceae bacterium]
MSLYGSRLTTQPTPFCMCEGEYDSTLCTGDLFYVMRIAYIINSLDGYGAGLPIPLIIRFMRSTGADVRVFAFARRDGRMESVLQEAGIPYEVQPKGGIVASVFWLRRRLAAYQPALLWTSLVHATLYGRGLGAILGLPVVSWQHNMFLKRGNILALAATRRMTNLWVADSETVATMTRRRFGLRADDIAVWPLFVADPDAPQARAAQPGECFRLGSLGRLHPHKGYDVLIRALAKLNRETPAVSATFKMIIGGEGADRARLEALARLHNVSNLEFAGYQENPRDFLSTLHGYIQPSRVEGLCISAHEAMQAGLPAIVSDIGEMPLSVQKDRTGFVVPPEDSEALAAAIHRLVAERARAAAMGAAARAHVNERFSQARFRIAGQEIMRTAYRLARPVSTDAASAAVAETWQPAAVMPARDSRNLG